VSSPLASVCTRSAASIGDRPASPSTVKFHRWASPRWRSVPSAAQTYIGQLSLICPADAGSAQARPSRTPRWRPRGPGSSLVRTRRAAGSSGTCTMACSSAWSPGADAQRYSARTRSPSSYPGKGPTLHRARCGAAHLGHLSAVARRRLHSRCFPLAADRRGPVLRRSAPGCRGGRASTWRRQRWPGSGCTTS
jgi:hypothetical protein